MYILLIFIKFVQVNLNQFNYVFSNKIISPFNYFEWELNKLYKTKLVTNTHNRGEYIPRNPFADTISQKYYGGWNDSHMLDFEVTVINQGFHGATNINRVKKLNCYNSNYFSIAKCIIPKGAEYFLDETGLIVSNEIKMIEILTK